jgi:hypothetical protein
MPSLRIILRRALIVGLVAVSAGAICHRALGIGPGWPAGPVPTPLPTPPSTPTPSPAPSPTPTPTATPSATPIPPSYVQIISLESPTLQYRDGSHLIGAAPPLGPYTCVVAMYLDSTDPVQFILVRTFEPRKLTGGYYPSQPVSSPGVSAQYTNPNQLANILTTLTVYPHPENPYGRETLSVYTADSHGNAQTLVASVPIMVYPKSTAKIFNALSLVPNSAPNPVPVASPSPYPNPSPYPLPSPPNVTAFAGDTARLNIEIYNAYPGGTTWVIYYPTASPTSFQEVPNSRLTAPATDLVAKRNVFIEVGTAKNFSGGLLFPSSASPISYTVQVVQYRPPYHDPPYPPNSPPFQESLATASFTVVASSFNINSQIGKLTP